MQTDTYQTIAKTAEGFFKDKGSKFLAFAYHVKNEREVDEHIKKLRKKYYDARHHCFAYRLGPDKKKYRANDDGEPSNTAGQPILGQIRSKDLTDVLIVVVRYFGGTLLGVSGLINAYKSASIDALNNADFITKTVNEIITISYEYADMDKVMRIIKDENLNKIEQNFDMTCSIKLSIRKSLVEKVLERFGKIDSLKIIDL